jgi:ribonucleoside-triphosphate reductase
MRGTYYGNHFSTIGLIGMNEACLNFLDQSIASEDGKKFAEDVLDFMNDKLIEYQQETGNLYNLEASPGEGTAYKQAKKDKEKYPDIVTAGTKEVPYYTNSVHLPVDYSDDPLEIIDHQDSLQTRFTGGTVIHLFLGEKVSKPQAAKKLIKNIFQNYELPYISLTPTFSICPNCGYIHGEQFRCPNCKIKQPKKVKKNIN